MVQSEQTKNDVCLLAKHRSNDDVGRERERKLHQKKKLYKKQKAVKDVYATGCVECWNKQMPPKQKLLQLFFFHPKNDRDK